MSFRQIATVFAVSLAAVSLVRRIAPGASRLLIRQEPRQFPMVSGYNLERQELVFPRDLGSDYAVVFVPFLRWQQEIVDSWIPFIQNLESNRSDLIYYELPTIDEMPAMGRLWLNEGMRAGIPDSTARERTVTLYLNTREFMHALEIPNKENVHIFLLDRNGTILWRASGRFDEEKGRSLSGNLPEL